MKQLNKLFLLLLFVFTAQFTFARIEDQDIENMDEGLVIQRITNSDIDVIMPGRVFSFSEAEVKLRFKNPEHTKLLISNNSLDFIINGQDTKLNFTNDGEASFKYKPVKGEELSIYCEEFSYHGQVNVVPSWVIIAPIVIILIALARRRMRRKTA